MAIGTERKVSITDIFEKVAARLFVSCVTWFEQQNKKQQFALQKLSFVFDNCFWIKSWKHWNKTLSLIYN